MPPVTLVAVVSITVLTVSDIANLLAIAKPVRGWSAIGKLSRNGLMGSARRGSNVLSKVNSLPPNPQLLIALHWPYVLLETGLPICSAEKRGDSWKVT